MRTIAASLVLAVSPAIPPGFAQDIRPDTEVVFLLHGMARSRLAMTTISRRFKKVGYRTVNFPYSPPLQTLDEISDRLLLSIAQNTGGKRYHLIGHSLGNIVIRNAFKKGYPPGLGRIVMLAPPNRPAKLARTFRNFFLYRWLMGDSGQKLADDAFYETLPIPTAEFGVIAGTKGTTLLSQTPNDGVVLVEATKLKGMKDFAELRRTHTFIMNAKDTFDFAKSFIETGAFPH